MSTWLEKVGNWGTWFLGNFVIWREIYEFETKKCIRNVGKYCSLAGKFYHVPGKSNIFSSHVCLSALESCRARFFGTQTPLSFAPDWTGRDPHRSFILHFLSCWSMSHHFVLIPLFVCMSMFNNSCEGHLYSLSYALCRRPTNLLYNFVSFNALLVNKLNLSLNIFSNLETGKKCRTNFVRFYLELNFKQHMTAGTFACYCLT